MHKSITSQLLYTQFLNSTKIPRNPNIFLLNGTGGNRITCDNILGCSHMTVSVPFYNLFKNNWEVTHWLSNYDRVKSLWVGLVGLPCSVLLVAVVSSLSEPQAPFAGHPAAAAANLLADYCCYPFLYCQDNPFSVSHSSLVRPSDCAAAVRDCLSGYPSWQQPDWVLPPPQPFQPVASVQVVVAVPGGAYLGMHQGRLQLPPSSQWKPLVLGCWRQWHPVVLAHQHVIAQITVCVLMLHPDCPNPAPLMVQRD